VCVVWSVRFMFSFVCVLVLWIRVFLVIFLILLESKATLPKSLNEKVIIYCRELIPEHGLLR
jgi:uncharacterized membrane protein YdbT with pleckstrin-like domain